jgi:formylglycine-generating enzyme required for sulfatase activity
MTGTAYSKKLCADGCRAHMGGVFVNNNGHVYRLAIRNIAIIATAIVLACTQAFLVGATGSKSVPGSKGSEAERIIQKHNFERKVQLQKLQKQLQSIKMIQVGEKKEYQVPIGENDTLTKVRGGFLIGETEVTYEQWYTVVQWAIKNGYTFDNLGDEGSHGKTGAEPTNKKKHPVTTVSFYDAVVFCNALSEIFGYKPVYVDRNTKKGVRDAKRLSEVYKSAQSSKPLNYDEGSTVSIDYKANGYRLPESNEWEMAARWIGTKSPTTNKSKFIAATSNGKTHYWTPGYYASGAKNTTGDELERVAWYSKNSSNSTQPVGKKAPNALGMQDVSGNVLERVHYTRKRGKQISAIRGGSWHYDSTDLPVSYVHPDAPTNTLSNVGFRLSRAGK